MIVTLTLNPAIDKSTEVERLIPEKKMRCPEMLTEAGGGGINVSKAICELGGNSLAVFTSGGYNGKLLEGLLKEKNISIKPITVAGNTRENIVVTELATNKQFRFVMPGPAISTLELNIIKTVISDLKDVSYLVCSGSLPPGAPDNFLGQVADIAKANEIKFVVDTSGQALKNALAKGVYLLKPNLSELCFLVGKDYLEVSEIDEAAQKVLGTGLCEVLIISMGPGGAKLVTKNEIIHIAAPVVKKQSTVGAGDSMVAGVVWMLDQGKNLKEAVQFGIACGTAATINKGTQLFKKEDAFRFFNWIRDHS